MSFIISGAVAAGAAASTMGAIALGVGAAAAVAGTAYTIVAGEDAKRKQADSLKKQEAAQRQAVAKAESQRRLSEQAINAKNKKTPDVANIMFAAQQGSSGGLAGTMLTGPSGVDPNALSLGKNTLLGG